jgi:hypothetical protein
MDPNAFLPIDRATAWNPGDDGCGRHPGLINELLLLTPRGGELDDTAQTQAAINLFSRYAQAHVKYAGVETSR